jgi:hypothetical protein
VLQVEERDGAKVARLLNEFTVSAAQLLETLDYNYYVFVFSFYDIIICFFRFPFLIGVDRKLRTRSSLI